jgi:peptidoglycan/xylan/chitin deacetylase (PgdA/CDA1 family)
MTLAAITGILKRLRPAGLVLLYHRVARVETDPQLLAVQPEVFERQMEMLRRTTTILPLVELVECAVHGRLPRRAVAVTFDDGYADNLHHAKPILERQRVPATLFAVSGAVRHQTEFWWDTLERALLGTQGRGKVELALNGDVRCWLLDGRPRDYAQWNVLSSEDPTPRHRAYRELAPLVKALLPAQRALVLRELLRTLGLPSGPERNARPMTAGELREMAAGGLVEIGAHSVSHPQLSMLPLADQAHQIERSKAELEVLIGAAVTSFAYPYGSRDDYTQDSVSLAQAAGFQRACANFPGMVQRSVDRMQIPRVIVRNVAPDALAKQLAQCFSEG